MYRYLQFLVIVFLPLVGIAQTSEASLIQFSGDIPQVNHQKPVQVFKQNARTYWLINDQWIWSLDVPSRSWKRWPDLRLDSIQTHAGYSAKTGSFYLWSQGTGLVYQWDPSTGEVKLISKPIDHKNQFGHVHFFRTAESGALYVFGGYGFWQYSNVMKYFDSRTGGWLLYMYPDSDKENQLPMPRTDAYSIYDPINDQFHVFSGSTTSYQRDDLSKSERSYALKEYWVLDMPTGKWDQKSLYGDFTNYPQHDTRPIIPFLSKNLSVIDTLHQHFWYPTWVTEAPSTIGLVLYNAQEDYALVTPLHIRYPDGMASLLTLIYDYDQNDLLTLWVPLSPAGEGAPIQHIYAQLPDSSALRALMLDQLTRFKHEQRNQPLFWVLLALLGASLPFYILKLRKRWNLDSFNTYLKSLRVNNTLKTLFYPDVEIHFFHTPTILLNKLDVSTQLSSTSQRLFLWLLWKRLEGNEYILAEDIETRFVGDLNNLDHLRKRRNSLIQRLNNELAQLLLAFPMCEISIKDRLFLDDKRKREYYLRLKQVNLITDLDPLYLAPKNAPVGWRAKMQKVDTSHILSISNRELWAKEIRESVQGKMGVSKDPAA